MKIFIYDKMINPEFNKNIGIPLQFICYAKMEGKMFRHFHSNNVFALQNKSRTYMNKYIYGALFELSDADFYIRNLDAHYACSLSMLRTNHKLDLHHRVYQKITPIHFNSIFDFTRLKYTQSESIETFVYIGNTSHKRIKNRLNKTHSYRLIDGVLINDLNILYKKENLND
jgi:hypothetical protein